MLGQFSTQLHGKLATLRNSYNAHVANTANPHGATIAATAGRLIIRDASGRAQVADPAAATDIANRQWVIAQIAATPGGSVTSVGAGTGLTGGPITGTGSLSIANTGVGAGSYSYPTLNINAQGQITGASSNYPVLGVTANGATGIVLGGTAQNPYINMYQATASQSGFMSAAYASKLDGIASGANVNTISSVFGRTGAVTANAGDYTVQKISGITVSTGAPSGGADGDVWFQVA